MKAIGFIVGIFICLGFVSINPTRVVITEQSQIVIKGKSNVNSFQCQYNSSLLEEEYCISFLKQRNAIVCRGAAIEIKSNGFDCKHKMITKDLKTILQADEFPNIKIELLELNDIATPITAKVNVSIAGQKNTYTLPVQYNAKNNNVKGLLKINIEDFALKAPKKLLGAIVVNNQVDIDFNLYFNIK
jgi:hypothetical protein